MRLGVEVGGTFTDLVLFDEGRVHVVKVPSVPSAPDDGAMNAIAASGAELGAVEDLVHGSTVATNAILERKGARVCLFVTRGTRDILQLQRHNRRQIYDLHYAKPVPVVARRDVFEITERMDAHGEVVLPLDLGQGTALVNRALAGGDYDSVAICFLNAYADPQHERAVAKLVREAAPGVTVTCSSDVCRQFREYERASTTVLAAYVQPVIDGYLERFSRRLQEQGYTGRFSVMQSNGGRLPARAMGHNAITSLFSGPAAGVTGAIRQAGRSGFDRLITLDMGGTSTDVCLVESGRPALAAETEIDGLPIKTPVIDIATVGAGGGSIVWIDDGDLLRVGPQSAGADPGPACYGHGGEHATITDAHILRGTVRAESFLGGRMDIHADASRVAFEPIARRLGLSLEAAADSAIAVAESNIVRAIQRISTQKGKDPRDFALVAFGGAGPMHAVRVAQDLGIGTVIVPPHAGVLSAYGLLASDFIHFETRTARMQVEAGCMQRFRDTVNALARSVSDYLVGMGLQGAPRLELTLDMRYVTQAFEIPVDVAMSDLPGLEAAHLARRFEDVHHQVFEFSEEGRKACEIVSFRVGAAVPPEQLPVLGQQDTGSAATGHQRLFEQGQWLECARLQRPAANGAVTSGPALVEDTTSTLFVPEGWQATVDVAGNLILDPASGAAS